MEIKIELSEDNCDAITIASLKKSLASISAGNPTPNESEVEMISALTKVLKFYGHIIE